MKTLKFDLHIHSCLSPCGDLEMSPSAIVERALALGLGLIALTDHNSARNCPTLKKICEKLPSLQCLYGMEITSSEEAHGLAYFDDLEKAMAMDEWVYDHLPDMPNIPEKFGDQVYVDEEESILGEVEKYLGNATDLPMEALLQQTHQLGGIFIPAHVDREAFSLMSQLGFIPDDPYDALEVSRYYLIKHRASKFKLPIITGSDAHYLEDMGKAFNTVEFAEGGFSKPMTEFLSENWERVNPVVL